MITVKAVGLRVADVSGSSDPYLVFQVLCLSPSKMCTLWSVCVCVCTCCLSFYGTKKITHTLEQG